MTLTGRDLHRSHGDDLAAAGLVDVTGLPAGVTATAVRTSGTTLAVRVTGTLPRLAKTKFAVLLTDGALGGVAAASVTGTGLSTLDPFAILVTDHWRAQLRVDYEEARLVVAGNYDGSTYAALVAARASARTVLADATSTDDEINNADAALNAAVDGLVLSQGGFRRLEAEKHDSWSGGTDLHDEATGIGGVRPGSWIGFNAISFARGPAAGPDPGPLLRSLRRRLRQRRGRGPPRRGRRPAAGDGRDPADGVGLRHLRHGDGRPRRTWRR